MRKLTLPFVDGNSRRIITAACAPAGNSLRSTPHRPRPILLSRRVSSGTRDQSGIHGGEGGGDATFFARYSYSPRDSFFCALANSISPFLTIAPHARRGCATERGRRTSCQNLQPFHAYQALLTVAAKAWMSRRNRIDARDEHYKHMYSDERD